MKDVLAAGLGNPLMGDEGIGVVLVQRLAELARALEDVEFLDLGTAPMGALHAMAGRRKAVLIDCALMGEPPGTIRRFTPDEAVSRKASPLASPHEGDLLRTIELSRRLGECPDEVVIFGIEPARIGPGEGLSPELAERLDEYVRLIRDELAAH